MSVSNQAPFALDDPASDLALKRVSVTLGVMSRCPDVLACEAVFDKVIEQVNTKVRLHMTYIGTPSKSGVKCMHGDQECRGNIQQLCVQDALKAGDSYDLSPSSAQRKWWNFIQCQNYAGIPRIGSEALAKQCLKVIDGPDWEKDGIARCIEGQKGKKLLKQSVIDSKKLDVGTSCTILIEGGSRCVRDGGQWKQCDLSGHEAGDFVRSIEKEWDRKNSFVAQSSRTLQTPTLVKRQTPSDIAPPPPPSNSGNSGGSVFSNGTRTPPSVFQLAKQYGRQPCSREGARLVKRQSVGDNTEGSSLPTPFLSFAVTAIALFVLIVAFVLLRIVVRNRRLRRLGLLPEGPMDRILGNARQMEDTLVPPKLWEAKIAHDYNPYKMDHDMKKAWDGVMPVSAAIPPNLYFDLFPNDAPVLTAKADNNQPSSYPPQQQNRASVIIRRMHVPSFLRRENGASGDEPAANIDAADAPASEEVTMENSKLEESVSASVNVTVLIAMPSPRTVFPSTRQPPRKGNALCNQPSITFPQLTKVQSSRLDEVDEDTDEDNSKLRRAPSFKSFKTAASGKSLAEVRREAFFDNMADTEAGDSHDATQPDQHHVDHDEDEDELPELVFGTASVPVFSRNTRQSPEAVRLPFSGITDTYHPLRADLLSLVTDAHRARERKARNEAAMKQAEANKEANSADDGHTTIDDRSTSNVRAGGATAAVRAGVGSGAAPRVSASETIDSEAGAQIAAVSAPRQDGLGDVVSRMMNDNNRGTSDSFDMEPRPSVGMASSLTNEDADRRTPTPLVNGSSLTLDPLLEDRP